MLLHTSYTIVNGANDIRRHRVIITVIYLYKQAG